MFHFSIAVISLLFCIYLLLDINECHSNPCLNDAICYDRIGKYICVCSSGFEGVNCEIGKLNFNLCFYHEVQIKNITRVIYWRQNKQTNTHTKNKQTNKQTKTRNTHTHTHTHPPPHPHTHPHTHQKLIDSLHRGPHLHTLDTNYPTVDCLIPLQRWTYFKRTFMLFAISWP